MTRIWQVFCMDVLSVEVAGAHYSRGKRPTPEVASRYQQRMRDAKSKDQTNSHVPIHYKMYSLFSFVSPKSPFDKVYRSCESIAEDVPNRPVPT